MELREYWAIIRRWLFLVITIIMIFTLAAGVFTYRYQKNIYQSYTTLIVSKNIDNSWTKELEYNEIRLYQELVKTYSVIAKSDRVLEEVIRHLDLDMAVEKLRSRVYVNSEEGTEIIRITVESPIPQEAQDIANTLAKVFQEQIKNLLRMDNVQVIDRAKLPINPIKPNRPMNLCMAVFIGVMVGIGCAFFINYLDNTIKDMEQIEKHLGLSTMALIPNTQTKGNRIFSGKKSVAPKHFFEDKLAGEAYRILRTNFQFTNVDKNLKIILITSPVQGEGKTTIGANLAQSLARIEKRVLLIDCDFRAPTLHKFFNISNRSGLSSILALDIRYKPNSTYTFPHIIPSGPRPPNPSELLGSASIKEFLENTKELYDFIIVDAPPVLPVADSVILSSFMDGVILVACYGKTTINTLSQAKDGLKKANANILGVVINKYPMSGHGGYGYYYQYHYTEKDDGILRRFLRKKL